MPLKVFLSLLVCSFALSCHQKKTTTSNFELENLTRLEVKYAKGFALFKTDDHFVLQVLNPFRDSKDTLHYLIGNKPEQFEDDSYRKIKWPLTNVVLLAGSHAAFFDQLGKADIITGVSTRSYFYNSTIQQNTINGKTTELGFGQNLNMEKLIVLNPQLMVLSGMASADVVRYAVAAEAGTAILPASEWQELHPLGRAEWIKVFGALTGNYEKAEAVFTEAEERYLDLKEKIVPGTAPKVLVNAPYKDLWWLPGGKSYMSTLIADAGGDYLWSDNPDAAGVQSDIEAVFHRARRADVWLNPSHFFTLKSLVAQDERYAEFLALREGEVYNIHGQMNDAGGNDYYELGMVRPDMVLADLIKIFHPELLPEHQLHFYKKLN